MGEGFGSWVEFVAFLNHERKKHDLYWHVGMEKPQWSMPTRGEHVLESDSSNRLDSQMIRDKKYEDAERLKHEAEEL